MKPQAYGGLARARNLSPAKRKALAQAAAKARWDQPRKEKKKKKKLAPAPVPQASPFDVVLPPSPVPTARHDPARPRTRDQFVHEFMHLVGAIDDVLVAHHGLRAALKTPHPPWDTPLPDVLAHYGVGVLFDLWLECRAVEALRLAWTGLPTPTATPQGDPPHE